VAERSSHEADSGTRELEARLLRMEAERDELVRALREARAAQHAAEEAVHARDEILAVVTHDLRNPLGTIVMGATALLQQGSVPDPSAQRVRSVAERIQRQAERMTRQLRDLQDFTDIQRGRLAIERAPHAPSTIIAAVKELAAPLARERGVAFDTHAAADLSPLDCDADRVVQALSSLVVNALKVTARAGSIEVGARSAPGDRQGVVFFVRHTGPSLDGEELPAMFAPGWRSKQPGYRGAAFGFTIARGVVDAHGGRIWAEGGGSTVLFSLQR
jgi:signal transduction histidine kinase